VGFVVVAATPQQPQTPPERTGTQMHVFVMAKENENLQLSKNCARRSAENWQNQRSIS
jgi:hypothetical protein